MATGLTVSGAHPAGEPAAARPAPIGEAVALDSFAGRIEVQWAPDEAVTALGQLPSFIDFLKQSDLFEPFVAEAPLRYASPNAPQVRDVLGTLLLAVTNGAARYSHVNAVRHDGVNPGLLDIRRVCSDDSVLRAVGWMPKQDAEKWLRGGAPAAAGAMGAGHRHDGEAGVRCRESYYSGSRTGVFLGLSWRRNDWKSRQSGNGRIGLIRGLR